MSLAATQLDALRGWLRDAGSPFAEVREIVQLKGGQSNPTYRLDTGAGPVVLRKRPAGARKWTHDVQREHTVLSALANSDVLTPQAFEYCADTSIVGGEFYLMEFVAGRIVDDCRLPEIPPDERRQVYRSFAREVARLHSVDPIALGLSDFGSSDGFVSRQLALHSELFRSYMPEGEPNMDRLSELLPGLEPAQGRTGIVNNDIRIGNAVLHPTEPRVIALLDWELSTLADTRVDASLLELPYYLPAGHPQGSLQSSDLAAEGLPEAEELLAWYAAEAPAPGLSDRDFFVAFNLFRYASVSAGIAHRYARGIAVAGDAHLYGETVAPTARAALELIERSDSRNSGPTVTAGRGPS